MNTNNTLMNSEQLERRDLLDASAELVRDVNLTPTLESDSARLGAEVFFAADDGTGDVELWKTDGTAEGTVRVLDIRSDGSSMPKGFHSLGDRV